MGQGLKTRLQEEAINGPIILPYQPSKSTPHVIKNSSNRTFSLFGSSNKMRHGLRDWKDHLVISHENPVLE